MIRTFADSQPSDLPLYFVHHCYRGQRVTTAVRTATNLGARLVVAQKFPSTRISHVSQDRAERAA